MSAPTERTVVEQARRLVADGRAWRARDLLLDHVESERDPEALAYLGEVLHDMGDLPRAGAVWFAAGARGAEVDAAVAAWREQTGDDFVAMWRSLPAPVREAPRPRRVEALRERARAAEGERAATDDPGAHPDGGAADDDSGSSGFDGAWVIAWVLALLFVVLAVIGFVTVLGWVVPG
ncbi:hypothetical protein ACK8HX_04050 [Oryzobacter sp. R7]|uniref:hypothetical protein n=1 Tax=Oryzobacter faecalis TaxID=3388656 RepID=UPI00398CC1A9